MNHHVLNHVLHSLNYFYTDSYSLHCNTKGSFPIQDRLGKLSLKIFILVEVGEDDVKCYNFKIGSV